MVECGGKRVRGLLPIGARALGENRKTDAGRARPLLAARTERPATTLAAPPARSGRRGPNKPLKQPWS
jgi:hypothetical protein